MALLECPDCGKHVSERATSCPNCGCPRSFFVPINSNVSPETNYSSQDNAYDDNNKRNELVTIIPEEKKYNYTFILGPKTFNYTEDDKNIAFLYGIFLRMALESQEKMSDMLDSCSNVRDAFERCRSLGNTIVDSVLDECMRFLYSNNVKITVVQFKSKYQNEYNFRFDEIIDALQREVGDLEVLKGRLDSARAREIASRARWSGGGFGLKGAIKGAATASLLNAGTDLLYSGHDSRREREDNARIRKGAEDLRNKGNSILSNVTYSVVMNIFFAYWKELESNKVVLSDLVINQNEANQLFETTIKYESDENNKISNILDCISMYPGELSYYSEIYDFLLTCDQFIDFVKFWNLEFLLEEYIGDKVKYDERLVEQRESETRLNEHNIPAFDYEDYSEENEATFLSLRYEYFKMINDIEIVDKDLKTYAYFASLRDIRPLEKDKIVFLWPPYNITLSEFLLLVFPFRKAGTSDFDKSKITYFTERKTNQIFGCECLAEEKIISGIKPHYKFSDYMNNSSSANTYGYLFSDKRIVELKSMSQIDLSSVEFMDIIFREDGSSSIRANICYCDENKNGINIYFCGTKNEIVREQHYLNLYEEIILRFYNSKVKHGIGRLYPDSRFSILCIFSKKFNFVAGLLTVFSDIILVEEINTHISKKWNIKDLSKIELKKNELVLSGKGVFSFDSFDISDDDALFEEFKKMDLQGVSLIKDGKQYSLSDISDCNDNSIETVSDSEERRSELLQSLTYLLARIEEKKQAELEKIEKELVLCSCGKKINRKMKFCNYCGNPNNLFLKECPDCKKMIRDDAKFCNYCGSDLKGN